ncbi:MAG TPA: iron ABC transporter permease [Sphaerochaeta sp.]|jgi:iron(III) transport system permease protein|nr:iron ABC transporter permease [Spirochaetales bacterium]HPK64451.1 iron ABC transporter permease [Sphaerochaeta sp.]
MSEQSAWTGFINRIGFWGIVIITIFAIALLFLIYPLFGMIARSFQGSEGQILSLEAYKDFFRLPYYYRTLKHSFIVSSLTTLFAVLLGVPFGFVVARYNIPGKKILNAMVVISLLSPPFIGAYSWIVLLGRNGFITNLLRLINIEIPTIYGFRGLILVFTLKLFPFIYMYVQGALQSFDSSLEEAAENLGVSGIKKLLTVTFPLILPTITAGAVIVFMTSMADLGTPLLIGEGYKVLPVLVYEEYMGELGGDAVMASAMSVIIIICTLSVLLLQRFTIGRRSYSMSGLNPPPIKKLKTGPFIILTTLSYLIAIIALSPQITTIVTSFIKTQGPIFVPAFSIKSYTDVWYKLSANITRTFLYSTIAMVFMIIIGMFTSYVIVRKKSNLTVVLDFILMSPYVIPGSVIGIILIMAFNKPPLMLAGTASILIISYTIRKIPYIIRSSTGILYQLDLSSEEASINLGVPPLKTFFKITAVLMLPGVISGGILSWISTINELSSTMILYSGRTGTISVAIYTEIIKDGYGTAAALASILTLATVLSLFLFNRLTKGKGSVI